MKVTSSKSPKCGKETDEKIGAGSGDKWPDGDGNMKVSTCKPGDTGSI